MLELFSAPTEGLLSLLKTLLIQKPPVEIFLSVWKGINYSLSVLYAFVLIYCGIKFMISGHDPEQRNKAKEGLKNAVIMIVLIQSSFLIYSMLAEISSSLSSAIYGMIKPSFFNCEPSLLEGMMVLAVPIAVLSAVIMLVIRQAIILIGTVLIPIAIFMYFVEPLSQYGELILSFILSSLFVNFFACLILLSFSKMSELEMYSSQQFVLLVSSLLWVDVLIFFVMLFSIIKSAFPKAKMIMRLIS